MATISLAERLNLRRLEDTVRDWRLVHNELNKSEIQGFTYNFTDKYGNHSIVYTRKESDNGKV